MNDSKRKPKPRANWKRLSILTLIASFCCIGAKCPQNPDVPEFNWNPPLYAPDSRAQVLVRGNQRIRTSDPVFDKMICTWANEIPKGKKAAIDIINQCEVWKKNANPYAVVETLEVLESETMAIQEEVAHE